MFPPRGLQVWDLESSGTHFPHELLYLLAVHNPLGSLGPSFNMRRVAVGELVWGKYQPHQLAAPGALTGALAGVRYNCQPQ